VLVFHDVGVDRLVNTYRAPVLVTRAVRYTSCPGMRRIYDMDNITHSVLVGAGGQLTFSKLTFQGSKSQTKTDWPSNIPLLLSMFKPVDNGQVILRDSNVRVRSMSDLGTALEQLPSGGSAAVEVPDLRPRYAGPACGAAPGQTSCQIVYWRLTQQGWLLFKMGGKHYQQMAMTAWEFYNVTVEEYEPEVCFEAARLLVSRGSAEY
jgi:hypothetical protein